MRISQILVRAPYDNPALTVLRDNGSLARDSYNGFAMMPSVVLRGSTIDVLRKSGIARHVVAPISSVHADASVEVTVTKFVLDCTGGEKKASVGVSAVFVDQKDRTISSVSFGDAAVSVKEGRFSEAFSSAYTLALSKALQ